MLLSALFSFMSLALVFTAEASVTERATVVASATVSDYWITVFSLPNPVQAGKEAAVFLKIHSLSDNEPARGGKVFINAQGRLQDVTEKGPDLNGDSGYVRALEADGLGNYEARVRFPEADTYFVKVRIDEIGGKTYNAPLSTGFTLEVEPPSNTGARLAAVMALLLLITGGGAYIMVLKARRAPAGPSGLNLLDIGWVRRLFRFRYLQPLFQVPMLVLFAVLIALAFFDIQDGGKNLSTKVIWTIWWAGIIFTFVLVGRMWCFMCPVGALSEWTSRLLKPRRRFPRRLRNLWIANGVFLLLTWLDAQLGVVRSPLVTGVLITSIIATAVLTAVFYQRRTFCRYLCPIGGIIGLYSMFSAVELRSRDCATCSGHERKDCFLGNENGLGCPMFEMVPAMDSNNHCNFCGECIKSCPRDNISLRARPFFKDAWTTARQSLDQAALAVVLIGVSIFVTGDMLMPWEGWMKSAMALVPADLLGIRYAYTVEVIAKSVLYFSISLVLIPGTVLLAAQTSNALAGRENHQGLLHTFTSFGYMFIPIGLSMHLAHNLGHLMKESLAVVPAFQRLVNEYTPFSLGEPDWDIATASLVGPDILYLMQMGLLVAFYCFSLYAGYRLAVRHFRPGASLRALMPMLAVSLVLMSMNAYLLNLPMAPRHIH